MKKEEYVKNVELVKYCNILNKDMLDDTWKDIKKIKMLEDVNWKILERIRQRKNEYFSNINNNTGE